MGIFRTEIDISAPLETVWHILTEEMPKDPQPFGITRIEGKLGDGQRIKLWSEVDPKRAFALTVSAFAPPHTMVWRGGLPLGLFTGIRTFGLSSVGAKTRFEMREVFSGALAGLIMKSMPDLTPSFDKFSHALKQRAEIDA